MYGDFAASSPFCGGAHVSFVVERDVAAVLAASIHHVGFVEHVELQAYEGSVVEQLPASCIIDNLNT